MIRYFSKNGKMVQCTFAEHQDPEEVLTIILRQTAGIQCQTILFVLKERDHYFHQWKN
jgi:hypothetical protein